MRRLPISRHLSGSFEVTFLILSFLHRLKEKLLQQEPPWQGWCHLQALFMLTLCGPDKWKPCGSALERLTALLWNADYAECPQSRWLSLCSTRRFWSEWWPYQQGKSPTQLIIRLHRVRETEHTKHTTRIKELLIFQCIWYKSNLCKTRFRPVVLNWLCFRMQN